MHIFTSICLWSFLACLAALAAIKAWHICRYCWRSFAGRRCEFVIFAALAAVCVVEAQKRRPTITVDAYLRDAGSYATNDVLHVAANAAPVLENADIENTAILVYYRPFDSTNATEWVELLPRRTFGDLPADWNVPNATNYNYMVYLDYVPPSPVHTNGVWQMRGFEVPGHAGTFAFPNTKQETIK